MMLQKNYLNTMSMTMSFSHIPSSNVASDSFVNKGTPKDLKGKNTKTYFLYKCYKKSDFWFIYRQYFNCILILFNVYPLSFSIDERYLCKEENFNLLNAL